MDRYQRVEKPRPEVPIMDNEIRITTQGMPRNYITYATTLLRERGASEVVLKAMGKAISKTVTIAEIIKRRISNLHQNTTISSAPITYMWEPLEEGLLPLETTRHVSMITITLSTRQLDTSSAGYQPPLPADQVKPLPEYEYEGEDSHQDVKGKGRPRGRGTGRGGNAASGNYQNGDAGAYYDSQDNGWNQSRGRFRGRGRGRSFPGRGRGFFGSPVQDSSNYNDFGMGGGDLPPRGQGRGRGRSSGNAQYGNGNFNDNGMGNMDFPPRGRGGNFNDNGMGTMDFPPRGRGGRGRGRFGDDGNYNDNGFRRGQGRGRGRFGGNAQDGRFGGNAQDGRFGGNAQDGSYYNDYGMAGGEVASRTLLAIPSTHSVSKSLHHTLLAIPSSHSEAKIGFRHTVLAIPPPHSVAKPSLRYAAHPCCHSLAIPPPHSVAKPSLRYAPHSVAKPSLRYAAHPCCHSLAIITWTMTNYTTYPPSMSPA